MSFTARVAKLPGKAARLEQLRFLSQSCTRLQEGSSHSSRGKDVDPERKHLLFIGLPRSAKPSDVLRLARQTIKDDGLASNIVSAQLDYNRFMPTGKAFLTMKSGRSADLARKHFQDAQLSSLPVKVFISRLVDMPRRRGVQGKQEAAQRGVLEGNGYAGGIDLKGCDVLVYGFPGSIAAPALRHYLRRIGMVKLAPNGEPDCEVIKIDIPRRGFTAVSKHLVRLKSPAEAHTFVRKMHMTFFLPEVWQQKHLIRAKVVY